MENKSSKSQWSLCSPCPLMLRNNAKAVAATGNENRLFCPKCHEEVSRVLPPPSSSRRTSCSLMEWWVFQMSRWSVAPVVLAKANTKIGVCVIITSCACSTRKCRGCCVGRCGAWWSRKILVHIIATLLDVKKRSSSLLTVRRAYTITVVLFSSLKCLLTIRVGFSQLCLWVLFEVENLAYQ